MSNQNSNLDIEQTVNQIRSLLVVLGSNDTFDCVSKHNTAGVLSAATDLVMSLDKKLAELSYCSDLSADCAKPKGIEESSCQNPTSADAEALKATIEVMDSLSSQGFNRIASTARLTMSALDMGSGNKDQDDIEIVLKSIADTAYDFANCINSEAEVVGCNSTDHMLVAG